MSDTTAPLPADERQDDRAILSLTFQMIVLMNLITRPFNAEHGARHGISLSEWRCIMWLAAHPGASGQDTADGIGMDRMGVSRNLRSLESKAMVKRRARAQDRKRWSWRLTEAGWTVYSDVLPAALERDALIGNALKTEDRASVAQFLAATRAMLEQESR